MNDTNNTTTTADQNSPQTPIPALVSRSTIGGILMGLANLVPGISGGTMLLASGIYPNFINAIAEITTLKFKPRSIITLATIIIAALAAIILLAGTVRDLVLNHQWIMYSIFIGLTLGGVPVVMKLAGKTNKKFWDATVIAFALMAALAYFQSSGPPATDATDATSNFILLTIAGAAAASAMILPGVSGGYLLLILGQYVVLLTAIDDFKLALKAKDIALAMDPALYVLLPVGIGVIIGVVAVSNILRVLLARYEKSTLGFLLGLLVGAVAGLWPFRHAITPQVGDIIKGQTMTAQLITELKPKDLPFDYFTPSITQIAAAIALIAAGFAVTSLVAFLGKDKPNT